MNCSHKGTFSFSSATTGAGISFLKDDGKSRAVQEAVDIGFDPFKESPSSVVDFGN